MTPTIAHQSREAAVPLTLAQLQAQLASGEFTSRQLTEASLAAISDPAGQGSATFIRRFDEAALSAADASDRRRAAGRTLSAVDGLTVAVKDLFDVAGYTTLAGSVLRENDPAAEHDALAVSRLRAAGAIVVGTTNMNEFALGTTGTNPHWGTPTNPWDRPTGRCPGGSSSGCAVAVADEMVAAAVGTDTAGSIRVPAALCGLVGFKPTASRVSRDGVFPLSSSLDSVGGMGHSVNCVAALDGVLSGDGDSASSGQSDGAQPGEMPDSAMTTREPATIDGSSTGAALDADTPSLRGRRLALLTTLVQDDLDEVVQRDHRAAVSALADAGAEVTELALPPLEQLPDLGQHGGLTLFEARQVHAERLRLHSDGFDPLVAKRLSLAAAITPERYEELLAARARLIAEVAPLTAPYDTLLMPTCPTVAPPLSQVADDAGWIAVNTRFVLWNIIANLLDRCALTLPCGRPGDGPVGLTLMGEYMGDGALLSLGQRVEAVLGNA